MNLKNRIMSKLGFIKKADPLYEFKKKFPNKSNIVEQEMNRLLKKMVLEIVEKGSQIEKNKVLTMSDNGDLNDTFDKKELKQIAERILDKNV